MASKATITIVVHRCFDLVGLNVDNTSNPFATLSIGRTSFSTSVRSGTCFPSFEERFTFESVPIPAFLQVNLSNKHEDLGIDEPLGTGTLTLLQVDEEQTKTIQLTHGGNAALASKAQGGCGSMELSVKVVKAVDSTSTPAPAPAQPQVSAPAPAPVPVPVPAPAPAPAPVAVPAASANASAHSQPVASVSPTPGASMGAGTIQAVQPVSAPAPPVVPIPTNVALQHSASHTVGDTAAPEPAPVVGARQTAEPSIPTPAPAKAAPTSEPQSAPAAASSQEMRPVESASPNRLPLGGVMAASNAVRFTAQGEGSEPYSSFHPAVSVNLPSRRAKEKIPTESKGKRPESADASAAVGLTSKKVKDLYQNRAELLRSAAAGDTALFVQLRQADPLLSHGFTHCVDYAGRTALHLAAWHGRIQVLEVLLRPALDGSLSQHPTLKFESMVSKSGNTILHCAALGGDLNCVQWLLQHVRGIEVCVRVINHRGLSPSQAAREVGNQAVADILSRYDTRTLFPAI
jgi:hypothetical protein